MKKLFMCVVTVFVCMLAACGGSAEAATLDDMFVSSDGKSFTLNDVRAFYPGANGVMTLEFTNGTNSGSYLQDAGGAVFAAMKARAFVQAHYIQLYGVNKFVRPDYARWSICSGNIMTFGWAQIGSQDFNDPSCVTFNKIKQLSQ